MSPQDQMQFRVGLNLGDVIVEGDNLFGDGVNVAVRMEPLAKPGGICISGKFYDEVYRKLELIFENVGAHEVKNIANPIQTYHVVLDQGSDVAAFDKGPDINKANVQKSIPIKNEKPRLIVLPFENSNNNEDNEFLVDGIVEDIITEFSRLNSIEIISRHSAFGCKNKGLDNSQIMKQFNVNYIATGSIRSSGKVTSLLLSSNTALLAGSVQNTVFVPAEKSTALSLLELSRIVVLDNVSGDASVTVPIPISNSVPLSLTIA